MTNAHIETDIQKSFIEWCWSPLAHRWPDAVIVAPRKVRVGRSTIEVMAKTLAFFHPANGEARDAITGSKLHKMGVRRGVLDLWLPVPRPGHCGLVIELKAPGGRMSKDQKVWEEFLSGRGWKVELAESFQECIDATVSYLDSNKEVVDAR